MPTIGQVNDTGLPHSRVEAAIKQHKYIQSLLETICLRNSEITNEVYGYGITYACSIRLKNVYKWEEFYKQHLDTIKALRVQDKNDMSDVCRIKRNYAGIMIALGRARTIDEAESLAIAQIKKEKGESFDEYAKRSLSILGIDDEGIEVLPTTRRIGKGSY